MKPPSPLDAGEAVVKPQAGRPSVLAEAQRRSLLMDAAARRFLSNGYAATTMSAIAVEAGMSKKTLYQVFPSKLAMFDALLEDRIFHLSIPADPGGGTQEEQLTRLVLALADVLLRPDRTGLIRLVITDGQASPELATAFERLKMGNKLNVLEAWLAREMASGALPAAHVPDVARLLFGMTIGEPMISALCRAPAKDDGQTMEQRMRTAVSVFLHGLSACSMGEGKPSG